MHTQAEVIETSLYAGPANHFYQLGNFRDFATIDMPLLLERNNLSPCFSVSSRDIDYDARLTDFNYHAVGKTLRYISFKEKRRCIVNLIGSDVEDEISSAIRNFIFEKDIDTP